MLKKDYFRWLIAFLALLLTALTLSSPALAAVEPLPLDHTVRGNPLSPEGWLSDTEYQDESIHMVLSQKKFQPRGSREEVVCRWVRVTIADPSQLRTVMSYDSYENAAQARPQAMVKDLNAVVAFNDDFMKYKYNVGHVIRQGVFYRDALNGERDVLVIDDQGDFSYVLTATSEEMADHLAALADQGRTAVNTFTFGPVMVVDGQVRPDMEDSFFRSLEAPLIAQRIAFCQLGPLEYGIVEIDGRSSDSGMNIPRLAEFILEVFPECRVAYNLDGGGSTHLMINGKLIHKTPGSRQISGLIYFASAATGEE